MSNGALTGLDVALHCMHTPLMRGLSFALAIALAIFVLLWPQHIARDLDQLEHGSLSLLLGFMCLLFVQGVGFRFESRVMRLLISPLLLWPVTAAMLVLTLGV